MTGITSALDRFDGTLSELYEDWSMKVLLALSSVKAFHDALAALVVRGAGSSWDAL